MTTPDSQPQQPASDLSNVRIGEFLLLRRLGSGGMADVYLAEQMSLGRNVAVKVLKNDAISGGSEVLLKRFEQEARAAGGLSHPNVVQIITTGRDGTVAYIVQEYVPGLNLSQWIRKHGPPDYQTGLKWMQQTAAALRAAADAGIVHRDVKPENILVTRSGVAKVTDFGLAQLNQPNTPRMNLTQAGTTMGTPWYMSPEQIQGEKLDHRSDQYSLGVTSYHMFAGKPPFAGKNPVTVAVQHLKEEAISLASLRADLPKELCDVIHRMLAKKPADRFQSAVELEEVLKSLDRVTPPAGLRNATGFVGKFLQWLPELRNAALIFVGLVVLVTVMVRRMTPAVELPKLPEPTEVAKASTAGQQFAQAVLQPDRQDLWNAVIRYFPDSPEADMASLRLGLALLSSAVPDVGQANKTFQSVRNKGELAPEKKYLELLGMIGQAYALREQRRTSELEFLLAEIDSRIEAYKSDEELQMDLDRAPVELQQFVQQLVMKKQQNNQDSFFGGGFGPPPRPPE